MSVVQMPDRDSFTGRLGAEIKAIMARAGVPQVELTRLLGVNQSAVSKRLRGVTPLDANEISIIAEYFGMRASELIQEAERPGPKRPGTDVDHETRARRDSNPQPSDPESRKRDRVVILDRFRDAVKASPVERPTVAPVVPLAPRRHRSAAA